MVEEISHEYTDEAVCPYCGVEQMDSWELGAAGHHNDGTTACDTCGALFRWTRDMSVTYSTEKIECPGKS